MVKKGSIVILAIILLIQVFWLSAYTAGIQAEISINTDTKTVTVQASGLTSGSMVSVMAYYDNALDYIDQYTADEAGNLQISYPSGKEWHENGEVAILINGQRFSVGGIQLNGIKISGAATIKRGKTSTYTIVCDPVDATCGVVWESITPNLVTVDQNGVVTAANATGFAFIRATTTDGKYVADFAIRVTT